MKNIRPLSKNEYSCLQRSLLLKFNVKFFLFLCGFPPPAAGENAKFFYSLKYPPFIIKRANIRNYPAKICVQ